VCGRISRCGVRYISRVCGGVRQCCIGCYQQRLAPPNPANVINASNSFPGIGQAVDVQNVGCNVNLIDPCPSPGGPTSVALVTGGVVGGILEAHETSSITMSGGTAGGLATVESSSATLSGGSASDLDASGSSTITMTGGSVHGELGAVDTSSITVTGGTAANANVYAEGSATPTITGGTFAGSNLAVGSGTTASIKLGGGAGWLGNVEPDSGSITVFGDDLVGAFSFGASEGISWPQDPRPQRPEIALAMPVHSTCDSAGRTEALPTQQSAPRRESRPRACSRWRACSGLRSPDVLRRRSYRIVRGGGLGESRYLNNNRDSPPLSSHVVRIPA